MKPFAPLLAVAALALVAPAASAAPEHRHDHGGGGGGGGGGYGGRGGGPYGAPAQGRPYGPYEGGSPGPGGRWSDRGAPPTQPYGPPDRQNSLGEGWREQQNEARAGVRSGALRPLGGVLIELRRRQPGHELDAGLESGPDGRPVYRVRWAAANGRRIDFIVDARTGAILSEEGR